MIPQYSGIKEVALMTYESVTVGRLVFALCLWLVVVCGHVSIGHWWTP